MKSDSCGHSCHISLKNKYIRRERFFASPAFLDCHF